MLTDKAEIAEALVSIYIYIYQDSLKTNSTYKFYYTLEEVMVFGNQPAGQKSCLVCYRAEIEGNSSRVRIP